jgi:hypothetical protein
MDMDLGQTHHIPLQAPSLALYPEIARKNWNHVIQGFVRYTKFYIQVPIARQSKMAQQGKQMRVGARKCFAHRSIKLVLMANSDR